MTVARLQFPFVTRERELGAASLVPMLPLTLVATRSVAVSGLLDTGATVNVLPYASGVALGFDGDHQTTLRAPISSSPQGRSNCPPPVSLILLLCGIVQVALCVEQGDLRGALWAEAPAGR
jgi:hypothetical protein